jgi:hypothetical protein
MLDLHNNKYDRKTLKENIYAVSLIEILKTQKIDASFAAKYILNEKYQINDCDQNIKINDVLKYQPHIKYNTLYKALCHYTSDDDSIDDFETVSNKNN